MICITGGEQDTADLARRLEAHAGAPLQEVRLDLLQRLDDGLWALLEGTPDLILTLRGEGEGGGFQGPEGERARLLRRALTCRPAYLDVEAAAPAELRRELFAARAETKLICSAHRFGGEGFGAGEAAALAREPADLLKVAVAVQDAAELSGLLGLLPDEQRPVLRIAMGDAGLLSRALYRRFGSPWTYVHAGEGPPVAPGQLDLAGAAALRLDREDLASLGLLGGPQVISSPGPAVYNRIFSRRDLPFRYLPVLTTRPRRMLPLLERLGFVGLSVTMPAKQALLPAAAGWLRPQDAEVGALNTLVWRDGAWLAANTDVDALAALLSPWAGAPALVLGAGGAARAAVAACARIGSPCAVSARDSGRAEALGAPVVPWAARGDHDFSLLINATPVGSSGRTDPLPSGVCLAGRVVLDAPLRPGGTALLRRAAADGAATLDGADWWVRQGAAQVPLLTGGTVRRSDIRQALEQTWRPA